MKIGILGGGQLAQMLALAGIPLGFKFSFYDPTADCCAGQLGQHFQGEYDDWHLLKKFAENNDIITYEFENVSIKAVEYLTKYCPVHPGTEALRLTQDRLLEKNLFQQLEIPTTKFFEINSFPDLKMAIKNLGLPLVMKSRSGGYDGKGQYVIKEESEIESIWETSPKRNLIAEEFVKFDREVSIIACRKSNNEFAIYDLVENTHEQGILKKSFNIINDPLLPIASQYVKNLMTHLNFCGVLALEFFQVKGGLVANEYAPRVHNTGHWTIEGAEVSQFENHLRAILDFPLGNTTSLGNTGMINFIGKLPDLKNSLVESNLHFHDYHKDPRPKRKVGHATIRSQSYESVKKLVDEFINSIK